MEIRKNREEKMVCNSCGKEIAVVKGIAREGVARIELDWGYFSKKDGEHHSACLCEDCYDKITGAFSIPVTVYEKNELL
ncbi:MAG: hypothetical protein MR308_08745 [Lachnospiraceae bacterium]|nr:hypothetical protein [Lachnospiraceae bacterium]